MKQEIGCNVVHIMNGKNSVDTCTWTEILIKTPFHPGYLTSDLVQKSPKLKLCVTAGIG